MKPEIKERWVEALRSGDYKQGRGRLKKGDEYCCLGVLCDIVKDELGLEWEEAINVVKCSKMNGFTHLPPRKLIDYCDIDERSPGIIVSTELASKFGIPKNIIKNATLSYLNDTIRLDFNQIADLIEEYL